MMTAWSMLTLSAMAVACPVAAQTVRVSGLTDVTFAALDPMRDTSRAIEVCAFSDTANAGYQITAQGSGAGNDFSLDAGSGDVLPFSVEWSDRAGQTSGLAMTPGLPLTGQTSLATDEACASGPTRSASLIIRIAASDLSAAHGGMSYSGMLSLIIAPQ